MSALLDRKHRALDDFVARVKESEIGDNIEVILYGSMLRGDAHEESDIDVLVIATGDLRQVDETCGDIAFDVMLDQGQRVSPMVYCVDVLHYPTSYFSYGAIRESKEVYSVEEETIRREEATDLLHLAQTYLEMARSF
jgi:predicted nucleotidyltransferase